MHAAVQSGGRSPKRLNGPSASQQLKTAPDGTQICGLSKGKKRDRGEQGIDPVKRDRDRLLKVDDSEPGNFKMDDMKSEIAKITEKGGLPNSEAVEELVHLMQFDRTEQKIDLAGRVILADVISATESSDCLGTFVQSRGLPVLDSWLQEAHKGKSGDGSSPKEADKPIEELLLALLRALAKLPINLSALQSCSIGKSVNHLRGHKNVEIQKKAKCLVENWKKRVDAEMKSNDVKPLVSGQSVSWPGKAGFQEISNAGNKRGGSSEHSPKNPMSNVSSSKVLTDKPGGADAVVKLNPVVKDQPCKSTGGTGGSELPTVKEEKSSSSSQSLNNSQSCSSDHAKTIGSSWKEDSRSSTAASCGASKTSGSSSWSHRRANNGLVVPGNLKEASTGHSLLPDKSSLSGMASEKGIDTPSDHGNNQRLIVRFPIPGRSPARSASGGSFEDPSVTGGRASSPVVADKHEQTDHRVKMKTESSRPHLASDANVDVESWHSNDKGAAGSEEGDKSPCAILDDDSSRTPEEASKDACASQVAYSSYMNEKGACSSETRVRSSFSPMNALIEIKYSEASHSLQAGDDTAMNLLASVAGEISKSELVSPSSSPKSSSSNKEACEGDNIGRSKVECDVSPSQDPGPTDVKKASLVAKEERHQTVPSPEPTDSKCIGSSAKIEIREEEHTNKCSSLPASVDLQGEDRKACTVRAKPEDGCTTKIGAVESTLGSHSSLFVSNRNLRLILAGESSLCSGDKQVQGLVKATDQKQFVGVSDHPGAIDRCDSTAGKLDLKAVEVKDGSTVQKEDEKKEYSSSSFADVNKLVVSATSPLGVANVIKEIKESKDCSGESGSHVKSEGIISQQSEHGAKHSSKKSSEGASKKEDGKEDLVSFDEGSSVAAKANSSTTAKLDFDLNEGIPGDDGHQFEPTISPVSCSSVINLLGLSPFTLPIASGQAPVTVAAPAKGPFVPPENLLRAKPETGWKGSAATSAFRPAEPRKILEMPLTTRDIPVSDAAGKQSRPTFDIDLNVADDQALEEDVSQSSAQTTCSEAGNMRNRDDSLRSAGIELDLNRADEVAENGQFTLNTSQRVEAPSLPARPLAGVFSNSVMNSSRDFDLNNGPSLDEASTEPAPRNLPAKNTGSMQFLPQVPGVRMSNSTMSNISPWFSSANPCAPVAIQSFLPARGDQPYSIEAAPGAQRIIASTADSGQFGGDSCRAPVFSTSPTMVFPPPAYQYAGFPFTPNVHLQTPGFSIGSTAFANSVPAGVPYFPTISPSLIGPPGALPAQHSRQYVSLPEGSSSSGRDSNRRWESQGLDLNSGPGSIDVEGKDDRVPLPVRQNFITPPHAFVEEQGRIYQMPGVGTKRKEPDGSWDTERSTYKQLSWQ
uniref:TFIIS N-terminal domain-containing protein n=1 Tax=Arundo donax TaxID=35708 RepID=A0A0A9CGI1_ARUDO